jgi:hypothetical protein
MGLSQWRIFFSAGAGPTYGLRFIVPYHWNKLTTKERVHVLLRSDAGQPALFPQAVAISGSEACAVSVENVFQFSDGGPEIVLSLLEGPLTAATLPDFIEPTADVLNLLAHVTIALRVRGREVGQYSIDFTHQAPDARPPTWTIAL